MTAAEKKSTHKRRSQRRSSPQKKPSNRKRDRALQAVYGGHDGRVPNMHKIEKGKGPWKKIIIIFIIIAALVAGAYFYINKHGIDGTVALITGNAQSDAELVLNGKQQAGVLSPYSLNVAVSSPDASRGTLSVFLPHDFVLEEAVPISTNIAGEREYQWELSGNDLSGAAPITLHGYFSGGLGDQKIFRSILTYEPENFGSEFQTNTSHAVKLTQTPLLLTIGGPERAMGGQEHVFTLGINNDSNQSLENIHIILPDIKELTLQFNDEDLVVESLGPGESVTKEISGIFTTETEGIFSTSWTLATDPDSQTIVAQRNHTIAVAQQAVALSIALDRDITELSPGQLLKGRLRYNNTSKQSLSQVRARLTLKAPAKNGKTLLNFDALQTTGSPSLTFSESDRAATIMWDSELIPTLENIKPNQAGVLSFSLPIHDSSEFDLTNLNKTSIELTADISYGDERTDAQPMSVALIADTSINAGAAKAGETVVVQWTMEHHFHDLENIVISANLFGDHAWLDQSDVSVGTLSYNQVRKRVEWSIPEFSATDGIAIASFAVQLSDDPTQTALMGQTTLEANDITADINIERRKAAVDIP